MSEAFRELRAIRQERDAILDSPLDGPREYARAREYYLDAINEEENIGYLYRYLPREFSLEDELLGVLDAFSETDQVYPEGLSINHLRLLRRVAFRRCAFGFAREINRRLRKKKASWWVWLQKDYLLPRIPLSLAIGYPVVLTLPTEWLGAVARQPRLAAGAIILCCSLAWFLIYTNVRDRLGNMTEAKVRATWVFGAALCWSGVFLGIGRLIANSDEKLNNLFRWPWALVLTASALVVAILAQFFFTKAGSIAEPL